MKREFVGQVLGLNAHPRRPHRSELDDLVDDAADPVGFIIENGEHKVGIVTDLGTATVLVRQRLKDLSALVIESNHDPGMLIGGPYPWELKQRIQSRVGHLANQETAALLRDARFADRWPITHVNASYGLDCHSWFNDYTIDQESSI